LDSAAESTQPATAVAADARRAAAKRPDHTPTPSRLRRVVACGLIEEEWIYPVVIDGCVAALFWTRQMKGIYEYTLKTHKSTISKSDERYFFFWERKEESRELQVPEDQPLRAHQNTGVPSTSLESLRGKGNLFPFFLNTSSPGTSKVHDQLAVSMGVWGLETSVCVSDPLRPAAFIERQEVPRPSISTRLYSASKFSSVFTRPLSISSNRRSTNE
jgi:hypothetical protein